MSVVGHTNSSTIHIDISKPSVSPLSSHLECRPRVLTSSSGTSNPTTCLTHLDRIYLEPRGFEKVAVAMF